MATIYNSDLMKELQSGARLQQNRDKTPNELAEKVVPTMEVNPKMLREVDFLANNVSGTSAASVTVLAADPNNEVYITHMIYSAIKNAACDVASGSFNASVTINGATVQLVSVQELTLTEQQILIPLSFPTPIKIDKNTSVRFTMPTFALGECRIGLTVGGYKIYNSKA